MGEITHAAGAAVGWFGRCGSSWARLASPHTTSYEETDMPNVSRETASEKVVFEGAEVRHEDLEGGYSVCFESHTADADLADLFRGLPDDRAQLPRWGYVIRGRMGFRFPDREETYAAGDAYYVPPGHTPVHYAGTEIVEFSPTEILSETIPVVLKNLEAAGVAVTSAGAQPLPHPA
jgi:hypothetical protein